MKSRDLGFSVCKAIRDSNGRAVKIWDEDKRRPMLSVPDLVDYRKDIMVDLKTLHFRSAPHKGALFVRKPLRSPVRQGYEDATSEFRKYVEAKCHRKYRAQFKRYREAYLKATERIGTLHVYVVPYAKVDARESMRDPPQ